MTRIVQELLDQAKTTEEIAEYFNTTKSAIHNLVVVKNLVRSRVTGTNQRLDLVIKEQNRQVLSSGLGAHTLGTFICENNHVVKQLVSNVIYKNTGCSECTRKTSLEELDLLKFIQDNYSGWIISNDRSILSGYELDIVLPDLGLAIEYNGTWWHSSTKVHPEYHQDKSMQVEAFGYQLLHINSHDWATKREVVKNKILYKLGLLKPKIYARNCVLKQITWAQAQEFLEVNHIQGAGAATSRNTALLYNNQIVAVMTFAKPKFDKHAALELVRFASSGVVGAAGKLFKPWKNKHIVTYALCDYSTGELYKTLGFVLSHRTAPGYAYYKKDQKLSRYQCQKHKLKDWVHYSQELTEEEIMLRSGYHKVYNSGNLVYYR